MPKHAAWQAYTCYGFAEYTSSVSSGFCDYLMDAPSRNYQLGNGYRLYNPTLMRFASADDESPFANGGENAYCYCDGDPVNRLDGSGRSWRNALVYKRVKLIPSEHGASLERLRELKNLKVAKLSPAFKAKFTLTRSRVIDSTRYGKIAPLVEYESAVNAKRAYLHMISDTRFKRRAIGMSRRDFDIAINAARFLQGTEDSTITRAHPDELSRRHEINMQGFSARMNRLRMARDLARLDLARHKQGLPEPDNVRTPAGRLPL